MRSNHSRALRPTPHPLPGVGRPAMPSRGGAPSMSIADTQCPAEESFGGPVGALKTAGAALDYLNAAVAERDGLACGELLVAVGEVQAKLAAAHAGLLRRFDAADAHDADGYRSSSAWLDAHGGGGNKGA